MKLSHIINRQDAIQEASFLPSCQKVTNAIERVKLRTRGYVIASVSEMIDKGYISQYVQRDDRKCMWSITRCAVAPSFVDWYMV